MKLNFCPASGWPVVLLSLVALSLAGCGRKGPLDLPPTASGPPSANLVPDSQADAASRPSVFNPNYGSDAPPTASRGNKRSFALDPLLGDDYKGK